MSELVTRAPAPPGAVPPQAAPEGGPASGAADRRPLGLRLRATWAGQVLAESDGAVELLREGRVVAVGVPAADLRWDLVRDEGRGGTGPAGPVRLASLDGSSPNPRWGAWSAATQPREVEGRDAVHRTDDGLVLLDHDRVRLEVVEVSTAGGEATTRLPRWGDVADLVRQLDVRREPDGSWTGLPAGDDEGRPVAEGSQLLAQALVAAVRSSGGRRPVSAHMAFARVVDPRRPIRFELDEVAGGRTLTTYAVRVVQEGRTRAAGTVLLDVTAPDVVAHQDPAPACAGPADAVPYDMSVTGRDLRVVDAAYTDDPAAPVGPAQIDAWVRLRDVPEDPALHVGLLVQPMGHMSIAAAMRPFDGVGQAQAHVTLSTGVSALHVALHRDARVDEWVRYHHRVGSTSGGMSHADNAAYDEQGRRLASFTVESLLRGFGDAAPRDPRTAL